MSEVLDFRKPAAAGAADGATAPDGATAVDGATASARGLACPVFLVGFMGAGKTSAARKLARMAGLAAIDMDTYIERLDGRSTSRIFAESGEGDFRALETQMLRQLVEGEPVLVSCGGGVVVTPENRELLRGDGAFTVYLKVTADEAASRISNLSTRPLFTDLDSARRLIRDRLPLYEEVADAAIDTAGRGSGSVARELMALLKREGILQM